MKRGGRTPAGEAVGAWEGVILGLIVREALKVAILRRSARLEREFGVFGYTLDLKEAGRGSRVCFFERSARRDAHGTGRAVR